MHKRSASLKTLCPLGAFVCPSLPVSIPNCCSRVDFFGMVVSATCSSVLGVDGGLLSMHGSSVLREWAFGLNARTTSAQGWALRIRVSL
mmetsp:Transcript_8141/g.16649  ORF Transcript_8141/g.16649 Transcript_8141/m.16649 type:complete len:89 (-) Transcript_8141:117-383(-)